MFTNNINRRDFVKQTTATALLAGLPAFTGGCSANPAKDIAAKILIIGGGAAGISVAARLRRKLNKAEITLVDPAVCSAILCNYSRLKQDSWGNYESDTWYMIYDFETVCDKALENYPLYMRIVEYKIDGMQNIDIQEALQLEFGIKHSLEYISSLWRKKIPALIASAAEDQYLDWYYLNVEKGKYKRCSRCGQVKLAHNKYFSKNKTSKDGFYSICKACRNSKAKKA